MEEEQLKKMHHTVPTLPTEIQHSEYSDFALQDLFVRGTYAVILADVMNKLGLLVSTANLAVQASTTSHLQHLYKPAISCLAECPLHPTAGGLNCNHTVNPL